MYCKDAPSKFAYLNILCSAGWGGSQQGPLCTVWGRVQFCSEWEEGPRRGLGGASQVWPSLCPSHQPYRYGESLTTLYIHTCVTGYLSVVQNPWLARQTANVISCFLRQRVIHNLPLTLLNKKSSIKLFPYLTIIVRKDQLMDNSFLSKKLNYIIAYKVSKHIIN